MTHEEKMLEILQQQLKSGRLHEIAAYALYIGLRQGYCELTDNRELYKVIGRFICPYCGRTHRSKLHDELNKLYTDTQAYELAFDKAYKSYPYSPCMEAIARYHPGFPTELFENPQEYVPE